MDFVTEDIKNQFSTFSGKFGPAAILPASVLAVNDDNTAKVQFSDDSIVDDARLRSVVKDGNYFLLIPKENSIVQVARIENSDEYLVIAVEEITAVKVLIGGVKVEVDENGFKVENGADGLKEVLQMIIQAVQQIVVLQGNNPDYVKLQNALTKIENLFS
jgi:hypothetical protein